jgi:hypothetical protein
MERKRIEETFETIPSHSNLACRQQHPRYRSGGSGGDHCRPPVSSCRVSLSLSCLEQPRRLLLLLRDRLMLRPAQFWPRGSFEASRTCLSESRNPSLLPPTASWVVIICRRSVFSEAAISSEQTQPPRAPCWQNPSTQHCHRQAHLPPVGGNACPKSPKRVLHVPQGGAEQGLRKPEIRPTHTTTTTAQREKPTRNMSGLGDLVTMCTILVPRRQPVRCSKQCGCSLPLKAGIGENALVGRCMADHGPAETRRWAICVG